ncbi:cardiolipin synthase [Senegalia massiliensis]|uniref:cardiolipin synthase n=1 Tax=Senegalia massiliensis TaxID=1720316 RepID=UPI001F5F4792|nr:cardiolipin synthase [Senegalia massiliensis]
MNKIKKYFLIIAIILFIIYVVPNFLLDLNILSLFDKNSAQRGIVDMVREFMFQFRSILSFLFTFYTISIGVIIFIENEDPQTTITWLLVLFIFPVVGFVLYLFLGQNIRKKKIFQKEENIRTKSLEDIAEIQLNAVKESKIFSEEKHSLKKKLISLILNNSKSPVTINNKSKILTNGKQKFKELKKDLSNAKKHIHIEYFIIKNDNIGNEIKNILIKKAEEGVEVRFIYDSAGSWRLGKKYIKSLKDAGVKVEGYLPVFLPGLSRDINYRNHRKIVIIDGNIAFTGGINIGDEYLGKSKKFGFWRDTHIKIEGEAVYALQNIFLNDWYFCTKENLEDLKYFPKLKYYGEQLIQISSSGPDTEWESIMQSYFSLITYANDRVWITTPYLIPNESMNVALRTAALSGIDVRIIIPDIADHIVAFWGSRSYVSELLKAGVKIYRYQKGFVHAKTLLVDDMVASVGTANLDNRSFHINFEVNAFVYDKDIANRLEKDFLKDFKNCDRINYEEYEQRGALQKFKEAIGRILSPIL